MSFPLTEEGLFDPVLTAACPEGTDPWNSGELDLDNLFDFNNLPFVGASDILTDVDGAWLSHAGTNVDTNVVTLQQPTTTTTMTMLQTTTPQPIAALQTATPISQHICSSQPTSDEDNDEEQLVQGVARQLKAFVDGLQISGKLDDIERLRFQLLEKDLIIAELREKLQRSEVSAHGLGSSSCPSAKLPAAETCCPANSSYENRPRAAAASSLHPGRTTAAAAAAPVHAAEAAAS